MKRIDVAYEPVVRCPLCGGVGDEQAVLRRRNYVFGQFVIPLPSGGVSLVACDRCALLYKSSVPDAQSFAAIMKAAAASVWRPKKGEHPAMTRIRRFLPAGPVDILDIGASNGDLLAQLASHAGRLSAVDIERFPLCGEIVTGEYILGEVDKPLEWSRKPYGLVTAFDVCEHFRDVGRAIDNILSLTASRGMIMLETGDWTTATNHLDTWYYTNLFEHHVFWSRQTFDYLCETRNCRLIAYERVVHKGRRVMSTAKRAILAMVTTVARTRGFPTLFYVLTGRDPTLLGPPHVMDHAFVILCRQGEA